MDLNRAIWLCLPYSYGASYLMLNVGWYKLTLVSNSCLIKFDQLKC
jgi:hypothetical protein